MTQISTPPGILPKNLAGFILRIPLEIILISFHGIVLRIVPKIPHKIGPGILQLISLEIISISPTEILPRTST